MYFELWSVKWLIFIETDYKAWHDAVHAIYFESKNNTRRYIGSGLNKSKLQSLSRCKQNVRPAWGHLLRWSSNADRIRFKLVPVLRIFWKSSLPQSIKKEIGPRINGENGIRIWSAAASSYFAATNMNTQKQTRVKYIQKVSVFWSTLCIVVDAGGRFMCLISEHLQLSYLESIKTTTDPAIQLHTAHGQVDGGH